MTDPMSSADRPTERTFVTDDAEAELAGLGFEPAVSATGAQADTTAEEKVTAVQRPRRRRSALRRRVTAFAILIAALGSMGSAYAAFASSSGAADSADSATSIAHGKQLYEVSCITCHGANLEGIKDQGPSLIGVGGAAAYFQVSTGRMPATGQGATIQRKTAKFSDQQTRDIAAYVQSVGGGPAVPTGKLRGNNAAVADGGELFRLNCASCHGTTFKGAPLSAGKIAPALNASTDEQLYTAMETGPGTMPVFSNNQITPTEKKAIIAYVQMIKSSDDPGGSGIDRIGPVSEAIVAWVAGIGALMIVILWIGAKSQ